MSLQTEPASDADAELVDERLNRLLRDHPPASTHPREFLGAQFDLGLAWVHFAEGCGGLGLAPRLQKQVGERIRAANGPSAWLRNPIGFGMCAPTLMTWGTDDQRAAYLRPLFTGAELWCQLFSEPASGSDVAALTSSAVRDGDEWVVNGQKVWTTLAHLARRGLLIARTDPGVPKHAGLSAFVVDMRAPGVEVRPLFQATGEAEFNEVFFTDARVPAAEIVGAPGDGWRVALTTLMNERVSIGAATPPRGSGPIAEALRLYVDAEPDRRTPELRDRLMQLWIRAETVRLTNIRAAEARRLGDPGPEGSIGKLAISELNRDISALAVDLLGANGMLYPAGYPMERTTRAAADTVQGAFLRSRANTIEGGTSEVMRNILGERVLGLPADVRVDRDLPWNELLRN